LKGVKYLLAALVMGISTIVMADDVMDNLTKTVAANLKHAYPNTKIQSVSPTPLPGIYQVVMGRNVAFVDASGRYFIFGHLFDMQKQVDLTASTSASADDGTQNVRLNFKDLPLNEAIKTVHGNGSRVVAVFSDPECPYCRQLEPELAKLNNVTIYTFLLPLASIHPDSPAEATAIWCQHDRSKAWNDFMLRGTQTSPPKAGCKTPLADIQTLAAKYNINGTPYLISGDGRIMPGAANSERLEAFIGGKQ